MSTKAMQCVALSAIAAMILSAGGAVAYAGASPDVKMVVTKTPLGAPGEEAEPETKIVVPVVINILKGIGCTDQEMFEIAEAALKRANEVLKQAGVVLKRERIYYNVNDESNADMDGMLEGDEVKKAHDEGVAEVTGTDGEGNPRTGLKITFAKSINLGDGVTDGAGLARLKSPWVGISKSNESIPHDEGETLAHEVGHALGGLPDLEDGDNDPDNLMHWEAIVGSPLTLNEEQKKKIRAGASSIGEEVKAGEGEKAPKEKVSTGRGSVGPITQSDDAPPSAERRLITEWISLDRIKIEDLGDPNAEPEDYESNGWIQCTPGADTESGNTESGDTEGASQNYTVYQAIDSDDDPATGFDIGPFVGVEWLLTLMVSIDDQTASAMLEHLESGSAMDMPVAITAMDWKMDGFDLLGERVVATQGTSFLHWSFEWSMPAPGFPDGAQLFTPAPGGVGRVHVLGTSSGALPAAPSGVDIFVDFAFYDITSIRPSIMTQGAAQVGDVVMITGERFAPGMPVGLLINDTPVDVAVPGPDGTFMHPMPLPPGIFGADGAGFDFITATTQTPLGLPLAPFLSATTWIAVIGPAADLNGDGIVNGADLANLLANWHAFPNPPVFGNPADLNGDGFVNGADLATLLANWG